MNKIKAFIKREKFLCFCVLILLALLIIFLVCSFFPTVVKTDDRTCVIFLGVDLERAENKRVPGIVFFNNSEGERKLLGVNFFVCYDGIKEEEWKYWEQERKEEYFSENSEDPNANCRFNYGSYIARMEYKEFEGGVVGEDIYIKKYYDYSVGSVEAE